MRKNPHIGSRIQLFFEIFKKLSGILSIKDDRLVKLHNAEIIRSIYLKKIPYSKTNNIRNTINTCNHINDS